MRQVRYDHPELRNMLADEYVLGTLHGAARRRFETLLQQDAALRQAVAASAARLNLLAEALPPTPLPSRVWTTIRRRIAPAPKAQMRAGLWFEIGFWRGLAFASLVLVSTMGLYIATAPAPPTYVVLVTDSAQKASWVLTQHEDSPRLTVYTVDSQPLPPDRSFQLWVKLAEEDSVRPLGLIPASGEATMQVDRRIAPDLNRAELFGVSIEPPGGSPTGQPTTQPTYFGAVLGY